MDKVATITFDDGGGAYIARQEATTGRFDYIVKIVLPEFGGEQQEHLLGRVVSVTTEPETRLLQPAPNFPGAISADVLRAIATLIEEAPLKWATTKDEDNGATTGQ